MHWLRGPRKRRLPAAICCYLALIAQLIAVFKGNSSMYLALGLEIAMGNFV